jgi:hypothetical protein
MTKLLDTAQEHLDAHDTILQTYRGVTDNTEGIIILSKHKLLFLQETGWLNKRYKAIIDLPYTQLTEIAVDASHKLSIATTTDQHHIITLDIEARFIEDVILHCIEALQLKAQVKTVKTSRKLRKSKTVKS